MLEFFHLATGFERTAVHKPVIVATSSVIKLVANLTKMLSYPFHRVLPNKRFTLPEHAAPLIKDGKPSRIPSISHRPRGL